MKGIKKKDLDAIGNLLDDVVNQMDILIGQAEAYREERSEDWADSEAGETYGEKQDTLQDFHDTASQLRDDLADFTNED